MRNRIKSQLVDRTIGAYVDWREACRAVDGAYRAWASATGPVTGLAFSRYEAALDAEERAAEAYARLVRRVRQVVTSDGDLSGPLAA